jgi:hypothetical protein
METGKVLGDFDMNRRAFPPSEGVAGMRGRRCPEKWLGSSILDTQKNIRHDFHAGHYTNISRTGHINRDSMPGC